MRFIRSAFTFPVLVVLCASQAAFPQQTAAQRIPHQLQKGIAAGMQRGVDYLLANQKEDGSWENHVGITALAATAINQMPGDNPQKQGPAVKKALEYIIGHAKPDGGIYGESVQNYSTAVSVMALVASGNPEYKTLIENAQKYMVGIQITGDPNDKTFGGIGYSSKSRPDLPNLTYALEALKTSGLSEDNPVWKRAVQFVQRTQNRTESNDQEYSLNDGGFTYMPGMGWQTAEPRSYGSMTYAGILSYSYADIKKGDPRVEAAMDWIRKNYTLEQNPNIGQKAVYYYYMVFAKALKAYGEPFITDGKGRRHNWREELCAKLLELQYPDGYWVNTDPAEWQDNKVLVTAFTLIALENALQ
ncbi:MAG: terpene cyclase/mutase family protein [Acidobacteria bacterium]|nr:terpene cyclase/mutase family protein [Acidobacteriota bacterium]